MTAVLPWLADVLVVLGLLVTTLAVYGMAWLPDVYARLHAASKAVFLGVTLILLATLAAGEWAITLRALLTAAFLLLTTPVAAHAIARAAFLSGERMATSGAIDESRRGIAQPPEGQSSSAVRGARQWKEAEARERARTAERRGDGQPP